MKCLCCKTSLNHDSMKFWGKLMLCKGCATLAEHAEQQLDDAFLRAKTQSLQWLEQHIMSGEILKGPKYQVPVVTTKVLGEDNTPDR